VGRWRLWLIWIGANAAGQAIAAVLVVAFTARLLSSLRALGIAPQGAGPIVTPIQLLLTGAIVGAAQWVVLRGKFRGAHLWIPVTTLGALAAAPVQVLTDQGFRTLLHYKPPAIQVMAWALAVGIVVGLCVAAAQFLLLRHAYVESKIWLVAGLAGWAIGASFATAIRIFPPTHPAFEFRGGDALGGLIAGGIGAAITGLALLRLLREGGKPRSFERQAHAAAS
jgi:hypothetical protein